MKTKLTTAQQEKITAISDKLKDMPYDRIYVDTLASFLDEWEIQIPITIPYMKDKQFQRAKWHEAVNYILCTNGTAGHDFLPGKRITKGNDDYGNLVISVDTTVKLERNPNWGEER